MKRINRVISVTVGRDNLGDFAEDHHYEQYCECLLHRLSQDYPGADVSITVGDVADVACRVHGDESAFEMNADVERIANDVFVIGDWA